LRAVAIESVIGSRRCGSDVLGHRLGRRRDRHLSLLEDGDESAIAAKVNDAVLRFVGEHEYPAAT
jgi:hypothetical protein